MVRWHLPPSGGVMGGWRPGGDGVHDETDGKCSKLGWKTVSGNVRNKPNMFTGRLGGGLRPQNHKSSDLVNNSTVNKQLVTSALPGLGGHVTQKRPQVCVNWLMLFTVVSTLYFSVCFLLLWSVHLVHWGICGCLSRPGDPPERGLDLRGSFFWLNKG